MKQKILITKPKSFESDVQIELSKGWLVKCMVSETFFTSTEYEGGKLTGRIFIILEK